VDCLGGPLRSVSQSFVRPSAGAALERMSFDRVFLGADAVTGGDGTSRGRPSPDPVHGADGPPQPGEVYVLADASKRGLRPFHA
jgi:DeoR/GlpR family transcriptional regulator of sugar metabolism